MVLRNNLSWPAVFDEGIVGQLYVEMLVNQFNMLSDITVDSKVSQLLNVESLLC